MSKVKDYFYYLLERVTSEQLENMSEEEIIALNNELSNEEESKEQ